MVVSPSTTAATGTSDGGAIDAFSAAAAAGTSSACGGTGSVLGGLGMRLGRDHPRAQCQPLQGPQAKHASVGMTTRRVGNDISKLVGRNTTKKT
jgi:hypothetical protein